MTNPAQAIYNWYRNTIRNPKYRWWLILGSLLYLLSPIDISPDFIPIIGWIDDGVIVTLLVTEISQLLLDRSRSRSDNKVAAETGDTAEPVDVNATPLK